MDICDKNIIFHINTPWLCTKCDMNIIFHIKLPGCVLIVKQCIIQETQHTIHSKQLPNHTTQGHRNGTQNLKRKRQERFRTVIGNSQ